MTAPLSDLIVLEESATADHLAAMLEAWTMSGSPV